MDCLTIHEKQVLIWAAVTLPILLIACGSDDPTNIEYAKPGENWHVYGIWGDEDDTERCKHGFPILSEPIKEIEHYNVVRQFSQEDILESYASTLCIIPLTIYIIRKHEDYQGWLRIEIEHYPAPLESTYTNGWIHTSWIQSADRLQPIDEY